MQELKKSVSLIYERARRTLAISRDEYALCDYAFYRSADPRQRIAGWCCDTKDAVADFVGITRPGLYKMMAKMQVRDLLEIEASTGFFRATAYFIDTQNDVKSDDDRKQSLQSSVNKVYSDRKQSLQPSVNKVTPQHRGIVRVKEDKEEREEGREIAPPLPPVGENFNFGAEKSTEPSPGGGAAGEPGGQPTPRGGNPEDWTWVDDPAPAHITTYAVPTSETFDTAPGGPTYRAEVRAPAERAVVKPKAKTPKAQAQPRAVEIPETHAAVAPELTRLLCKKHYLQKSAERLAAEMGWLFSKPVAFAIRHIQDSLSSPKGAWAALDFIGCEDTFSRWQRDERARAQAQQGPGASGQTMQRAQSPIHQSPVFGERRL